MSEQSALAAAGFELPPDPEAAQLDERRRRLALEQAVAFGVSVVNASGLQADVKASDVAACAERFHAFLSGKTAQPQE